MAFWIECDIENDRDNPRKGTVKVTNSPTLPFIAITLSSGGKYTQLYNRPFGNEMR